MTKFFIAALLCVAACAQLSTAASIAEAIDIDLRENLSSYNKILPEVDAAHKADLEKLITQTETALKETDPKEKNKILDALHGAFPEEFNQYLSKKLQELHIDADIQRSLSFYTTLLEKTEAGEWKQDIEQAIANLNSITSETDAAKKVELYAQFSKQLKTDFQDFLKKQTLPQIEQSLSGTIKFFDGLLAEADAPHKNEIAALKTQAEAGLAATTLEEKQKIYYEITNPADKELFNYLKEKYIEKN
ncbi:PREDICTED: uncharacterized protein LOC108359680 [Rhagoletis zephyria]|uniref:uncharacterized protein LOC108359680 n=1 Tax=Rhagoletis zephyria TaxID=28612 RepID=UPI0008117D8D|nr:PREDICTED: uncharacterized protein LOC108359680 [Rhagoletis zephyria]XP_036321211.1 uncharacterized protein LOC118735520 [Rhagoletis pomonella]